MGRASDSLGATLWKYDWSCQGSVASSSGVDLQGDPFRLSWTGCLADLGGHRDESTAGVGDGFLLGFVADTDSGRYTTTFGDSTRDSVSVDTLLQELDDPGGPDKLSGVGASGDWRDGDFPDQVVVGGHGSGSAMGQHATAVPEDCGRLERQAGQALPSFKASPIVQMSINVCNERMSAILASRMRLGKPASITTPTVKEETVEVDVFEANKRRWARLQWFYKQLGTLTELEVLDLRATTGFAEEEPTKVLRPYVEFTFPRLLCLSDDDATMAKMVQEGGPQQGKIGYLRELSQLRKFRELRGSFRIDRPAVKTYMGLKEVEFMHAHWPELRVAEFLPEGYEALEDGSIPSHMQWLIEQCPFTKLSKAEPDIPQFFGGI